MFILFPAGECFSLKYDDVQSIDLSFNLGNSNDGQLNRLLVEYINSTKRKSLVGCFLFSYCVISPIDRHRWIVSLIRRQDDDDIDRSN